MNLLFISSVLFKAQLRREIRGEGGPNCLHDGLHFLQSRAFTGALRTRLGPHPVAGEGWDEFEGMVDSESDSELLEELGLLDDLDESVQSSDSGL